MQKPAWLENWETWPKALLDNWIHWWWEGAPWRPCAMPGCGLETQVTLTRSGRSPVNNDEARHTCSLAHSLMIASGEAD